MQLEVQKIGTFVTDFTDVTLKSQSNPSRSKFSFAKFL